MTPAKGRTPRTDGPFMLVWKHEQEWKPEGERVDPAEVRALLSKHGIAA